MIIALATPRIATSLEEGLGKVRDMIAEAAAQGAAIVCFPECYLPGLRGVDIEVPPFSEEDFQRVLKQVSDWAHQYHVATILGTERIMPAGRENLAVVFGRDGELLGVQTKNQVAPSEDPYYVPGNCRRLFEVLGVKFGISICHEGWRYPETVRWAAVRGASIVFHPQLTGSDREGIQLAEFGSPGAPYYEKALVCRSIENGIYFASVNYALKYQESATCLIDPEGKCQAYLPYGEEGLLVQSIDLFKATRHLAERFAPERYQECPSN